ncbi:MAG TPA: hypothetical protein VFV52_18490 [Bacilli bacterium]|nr:hypothetical protein [Bacilli bacterium]
MTLTRQGRFVDEPFPNLCDWVSHPEVPSPAGGTVVASCAALAASLTELLARVTRNRLERKMTASRSAELQRRQADGDGETGLTSGQERVLAGEGAYAVDGVDEQEVARIEQLLTEARQVRDRLLEYGEGDVYEAQKIIQGRRAACVRKDVGSPAKIAGTIVKLLRLVDGLAPSVRPALHSDLFVVTYLAYGGVLGITEICLANVRSSGDEDEKLVERIEGWRRQAKEYRDRILSVAGQA